MDNQIDVSNPLGGLTGAPSAPIAPTAPQAPSVQNPLAPGTTPASLSTTATPNNPEGFPLQAPNVPTSQPVKPSAPSQGSFAQKLLSAIGGVLQGVQSAAQVGVAPNHMEELARQQAVKQNKERYDAEQKRLAQERQDKLTEQEKVDKRADDEAAARNTEANIRKHSIIDNDYRLGTDYMQKQVDRDLADLKNLESGEVPAQVIQRGVTGDQLTNLLRENKINVHDYTIKRSGLAPDGEDENGNPKMAYQYEIVKVPDKAPPLTADQIARIKTVPGYENIVSGTQLTGASAELALTQADQIRSTHDAVNAARAKHDIDALTDKQESDLAAFNKEGDWQKYLNAYSKPGNIDMVSAAAHMLADPAMAKKYGSSLYTDVMKQFADKNDPAGPENYEKMRHNLADEAAKAEENRLKKAEATKFEGNLNLTGDAFLKTLPPESAGMVKQAGDGRMSNMVLARLIAKNPSFGEAVASYAPDFDPAKVEGWVSATKDYTNDKAGGVGGTLNAGATALKGLRKLYDDTTLDSLRPGSKANKDRQNDIATIANEVAKFNSGGRQPSTKDVEDIKESLDPTIPLTGGMLANPINRREAVKNQTELLQKKIQEYEDTWHSKAPSPRYETPMPNMSNDARIDAAYVLNDGKYQVPRGAQAFVDPKTNHQIFTFDGKTYYDSSNGQQVNPMTPGAR
jgi:hypothetical protein